MINACALRALLVISVSASSLLADDSACRPLIPPGGAFKITLQSGKSTTFSSAKDWFCSDDFLSSAKENGTNIGVTIPLVDVPIGGSFDYKNQESLQQRKQFCSAASRNFSAEQQTLLLVKEGDPVLANAYVKCVGSQAQRQFLHVDADQNSDSTFQLTIDSAPFPGTNPLIIDVKPAVNAKALLDDDFVPNHSIPFDSTGAKLRGLYSFDGVGNQAVVLIRTTIGTKAVTVSKCKQGPAGTYILSGRQLSTADKSAGTRNFTIGWRQAGCHAHCCPGCGDWLDADLTVDAPLKIVSAKFEGCDGNGCVFDDAQPPVRVNDQTWHVRFKSRSEAVTGRYSAVLVQPSAEYNDVVISQGNLAWGSIFSVQVDDSLQPILTVSSPAYGECKLTSAGLSSSTFPNWLTAVGAPQTVDAHTRIFTLRVVDPNCKATSVQ
jgi:hypothetical protein